MPTPNAPETSYPNTVLRLLAGLQRTATGAAIYRHVSAVLRNHEATHAEVEAAYAELLKTLLTAFADRVPAGSALQVQLKLILMHLTPPLSVAELTTLHNCLQIYAEEMAGQTPAEVAGMEDALTPLLQEYTGQAPAAAKVAPAPMAAAPAEAAAPAGPAASDEEAPARFAERRQSPRATTMVERRVDAAYRQHLNEKRQSIQRIQQQLAQQITDTIRQSEEFGVLLDVELEHLRQAGTQQELDILRKTLISEVEKLQQAHQALTERLEDTHKYLQMVEADSQQLSDELTRVHLLSLTDELTDLPNRRAFMRRLEDEVGRVQRYGSVLSLVIIDIDGFKAINDRYGHAVGDETLKVYARQVLSIFRHHDMVARYGGEEFSVLLPNTDIAGAMSAVAKVQRRAAELTIKLDAAGASIPLPTFSAGVALYQPGETPTDLIERADAALYRAKNTGRNRIEIAADEGAGAVIR